MCLNYLDQYPREELILMVPPTHECTCVYTHTHLSRHATFAKTGCRLGASCVLNLHLKDKGTCKLSPVPKVKCTCLQMSGILHTAITNGEVTLLKFLRFVSRPAAV
jgi:hypothetical protein